MRHTGFTLIELTMVIAIIVVLAAVIVPILRDQAEDAKVAKLLALYETVKDACIRYYADTGVYGAESSSTSGRHQLSLNNPPAAGWNGPYMNRPLAESDNPFPRPNPSAILPQAEARSQLLTTFDLDGDTVQDTESGAPGNYIRYYPVTETAAQKIDGSLDSGVNGEWQETGRVKKSTTLEIYISGGRD